MEIGDTVKVVKLLEDVDQLDQTTVGQVGKVVGIYMGHKAYSEPTYWVCLNPANNIDHWLYESELEKLDTVPAV